MRRRLSCHAWAVVVTALVLTPTLAWARNEKLLGYSPEAVWNPLVRFVRVDENMKIIDKDAEAGYLIFELRQDKKVFRGTVEVIAASKEYGARVILDITDRPSYVELAMLERLERKLIAELGPAPSAPRRPEPKPARPDKPDPSDPGPGAAPMRPIPEPAPPPNR
jgi:hypothetical protein